MIKHDVHLAKDNIKTALFYLHKCISEARRDKDRIVMFITGYGSKGNTHKIRTSVIEELEELIKKNSIKCYILGSDILELNDKYLNFLKFMKNPIPNEMKSNNSSGVIYIKV